MVLVDFIEVGRDKKSWQATLKSLDYDSLYREVRRNGGLGSRDLEFGQEPDSNKGVILAGFRNVGQFIVRNESAPKKRRKP